MDTNTNSFKQNIVNYFSEFKVLKTVSKDFWLLNLMHFFEVMSYFAMSKIITLYLTNNVGFSDISSGKWVSYYTLFIVVFVFAVGAICDVVGIKRTLIAGLSFLFVGYAGMTLAPIYFSPETAEWIVKFCLILLALGMATMSPPLKSALRRFTSKENRATGFNVYYLIMNIGAVVAYVCLINFCRNYFGITEGNLWLLGFAAFSIILAIICMVFIDENNYAEESERMETTQTQRPLAIFREVWRERPFQKLLLFLFLTIGVKLVFTNEFLVMPKYYTRVLTEDFELGSFSAINPLIIVFGLIAIIPIMNKYSTVKMLILGMTISASSLFVICIPPHWLMMIPGISTISEAYLFAIVVQIVLFAVGEIIFNPRFTEYTASVAPKDKVASYMSLAALPMFIAKPINGFISGVLITYFCYDGIRAKIDTANVGYSDSPEFMWLVYAIFAAISPIAVIAMKNFFDDHSAAASKDKAEEHQPDLAALSPGEIDAETESPSLNSTSQS